MKDIKFLNLLIENSEFKVIKTGERTINKRVKEKIKKLFAGTKVEKIFVPNIGYVFYFKNKSNKNIGMMNVDKKIGVIIRILK
jgi:hypothetical protein